jgi:hypothetical protein
MTIRKEKDSTEKVFVLKHVNLISSHLSQLEPKSKPNDHIVSVTSLHTTKGNEKDSTEKVFVLKYINLISAHLFDF